MGCSNFPDRSEITYVSLLKLFVLPHCMLQGDGGTFRAYQGPQEGAEEAGEGGPPQEEGGVGGQGSGRPKEKFCLSAESRKTAFQKSSFLQKYRKNRKRVFLPKCHLSAEKGPFCRPRKAKSSLESSIMYYLEDNRLQ